MAEDEKNELNNQESTNKTIYPTKTTNDAIKDFNSVEEFLKYENKLKADAIKEIDSSKNTVQNTSNNLNLKADNQNTPFPTEKPDIIEDTTHYGVSKQTLAQRKIEEKNRKLIEEIRGVQQQQKKKRKKRLWILLWLLLLIIFLGGGTTAIILIATKNDNPPPVPNPLSIEILGDFNFSGNETINIYPGTKFEQELWIRNKSTEDSSVFIRFYVESYVNNEKTSTPLLDLIPNNTANFVSSSDKIFYYKGILPADISLQIITDVIVLGNNEHANQTVTHKIVVDAIESNASAIDEIWPTAPIPWQTYMKETYN